MMSAIDEDNLMCSICLCLFNKPVALPCGHSFCLDCITHYCDTKKPKLPDCPLCGETFSFTPVLRVNICIQEIVANFKKSCLQISSETAGVCKTHLEPQQQMSKEHKRIDLDENLESRICKTHYEDLQLFCRKDQVFICETCLNTDHRGHKCVSFREEAEIKKAQLDMEKTKMKQLIIVRQQKISEIQESMKASRNNAEKAQSYSDHVTTDLVDCIKRSHAELSEVIELKQVKVETEAEGFIKELEGEIRQISKKNTDLNVTFSDDPFINVKNLLALTIPPTQLKDWSHVSFKSEAFEVNEAISSLAVTVTKEIQRLCDPDLKTLKTYAVDVTLDPDTANTSLVVSEDGKQVSYSDRRMNVPNKPGRFINVQSVLAKESFSEGKFYYEVQVKDKTQWDLGVASESINRKGDVRQSPRNGYWTIWLRDGHGFRANAGPAVNIQVRHRPEKIGVFVDCDEGQVSFYDADSRAMMYTFDHCDFTEKIFPFFSPCSNDRGKNTAPLIITPVQNN